jgi:hypothetical protein
VCSKGVLANSPVGSSLVLGRLLSRWLHTTENTTSSHAISVHSIRTYRVLSAVSLSNSRPSMVVRPMLLSDLYHHTQFISTYKATQHRHSCCVQHLELCDVVKDAGGKRGCTDVVQQQACQIGESVEHACCEHKWIVAQAPVKSKTKRSVLSMHCQVSETQQGVIQHGGV